MPTFETSLTEVYVLIDDLVANQVPPGRPGPSPSLSPSEVVTLALVSQLSRFASTREFYRFAEVRLRACFPRLPHRTQFIRQVHRFVGLIAWVATELGAQLAAGAAFEILDCTPMPTRTGMRRGHGWMPGEMTNGYSTRLGYYTGAKVLTCVSPTGVLTGVGLAPANVQDRTLAEAFLAQRAAHDATDGVGHALGTDYLADQGFGGRALEARYLERYRVQLICPPQTGRRTRIWPKTLHRWLIGLRQPIEAVHRNLVEVFRLDRNRPHSVTGAFGNLVAIAAMHNVVVWLNRSHGRPDLTFVGVIGW